MQLESCTLVSTHSRLSDDICMKPNMSVAGVPYENLGFPGDWKLNLAYVTQQLYMLVQKAWLFKASKLSA